eukprot:gene25068-22581_t
MRDDTVDHLLKAVKHVGQLGTDDAVEQLDAEERRAVQPSLSSLRVRLIHGEEPLSDVALPEDMWSETLLRRDDWRWRRNLDFIAVAASVLMRRKIVRRVKGLLRVPHFRRDAEKCLEINEDALKETFRVIGEKGSIREALRGDGVPESMLLAQSTIPGTDGYRDSLRYRIQALRAARGQPTFWLTLNPADVRHPLVLRLVDPRLLREVHDGGVDLSSTLDLFACESEEAMRMPSARHMQRLIAEDPVAAVAFFYRAIRLTLKELLGIDAPLTGTPLDADGCAASGGGGVLGDADALFGWHASDLVDAIRGRYFGPDGFRARFLRWVEALSFESVRTLPAKFGVGCRDIDTDAESGADTDAGSRGSGGAPGDPGDRGDGGVELPPMWWSDHQRAMSGKASESTAERRARQRHEARNQRDVEQAPPLAALQDAWDGQADFGQTWWGEGCEVVVNEDFVGKLSKTAMAADGKKLFAPLKTGEKGIVVKVLGGTGDALVRFESEEVWVKRADFGKLSHLDAAAAVAQPASAHVVKGKRLHPDPPRTRGEIARGERVAATVDPGLDALGQDKGAIVRIRDHGWETRSTFAVSVVGRHNHDVSTLDHLAVADDGTDDDVARAIADIADATNAAIHYTMFYLTKDAPDAEKVFSLISRGLRRLHEELDQRRAARAAAAPAA